jgi:phage shock protein PspC (stress-responsive transcriptional regulator)
MKEVTRIHIAKISYEIEINAKKELESYLKALENYSGDADILTDVEIRITEILEERGVRKNGVITAADVEALTEQLGEPREFKGEESSPIENAGSPSDTNRKLFRDTDHAVFGGVLAGIAAFFKVNPALVRVLFIIVALASFGTALLVYAVLWIAVPPARTAADKLQMAGRQVTVESIREFNEADESRKDAPTGANRRVVTAIAGIFSVVGASIAAMITLTAAFAMLFGSQHFVLEAGTGARYLMGASGLAIASGTLLTVLFILSAYAFFAQKLTKRVLVSICVVIITGIVTFGGAIGLAKYGSYQHSYYVDANTRSQTVPMPGNARFASALALDSKGVQVKYFATDSAPYAELHAVVNDQSDLPSVQMHIEGKTLHLSVTQKQSDDCRKTLWWCGDSQPTLEIHSPVLTALSAENNSMIEYQTSLQDGLQVTAKDNVSVTVLPGTIKSVKVQEGSDSVVSLTQATVYELTVATIGSSSNLEAGTVRTLDVKDEGSCPSHVRSARVSVWKVTSGSMSFNEQKKAAATMDSGCTEIDIEGEEDS